MEENLEDVGKDNLEEEENKPRKCVDYYQLCLNHFNTKRVNELLPEDRQLLDKENKLHILHTDVHHHHWLNMFFKAIKALGSAIDKEMEWSDGIHISNSNEQC